MQAINNLNLHCVATRYGEKESREGSRGWWGECSFKQVLWEGFREDVTFPYRTWKPGTINSIRLQVSGMAQLTKGHRGTQLPQGGASLLALSRPLPPIPPLHTHTLGFFTVGLEGTRRPRESLQVALISKGLPQSLWASVCGLTSEWPFISRFCGGGGGGV